MKKILAVIACATFVLGNVGCSNTNNLSKYDWGSPLQEKLNDIGVKRIKSVKDEASEATKDMVAEVTVEADDKKINALISKNTDGTWEVLSLSDSNDNKIYYEPDYIQKNEDGTQKDNIYDYKTGNIIKEAKKEESPSKTENHKDNSNTSALSEDDLKAKAKELLKSYNIKDLYTDIHSEDMQVILNIQLDANVDENGAKKIAKEISDKIKPLCNYYNIEVDNNYKLILLSTQDNFK